MSKGSFDDRFEISARRASTCGGPVADGAAGQFPVGLKRFARMRFLPRAQMAHLHLLKSRWGRLSVGGAIGRE